MNITTYYTGLILTISVRLLSRNLRLKEEENDMGCTYEFINSTGRRLKRTFFSEECAKYFAKKHGLTFLGRHFRSVNKIRE